MSKKFMVIGVRGGQGFFSNFLHTLQYLYSSELENRIPIVYWKGGIYAEKDGYRGVNGNVWEYYFNRVSEYSIEDIDKKYVKYVRKYRNRSLESEPPYCWDYKKDPPEICVNNPSKEARVFVNNIINKYIVIREDIQKQIDCFYNEHMKGYNVLGVHVRYCNDHRFSSVNPLKKTIKLISRYLDDNDGSKLFLATDFYPILEGIKNKFGDRVIYTKSTRSIDGNPLQYGCKHKTSNETGGAIVGEEVIIDCKLLSQCNMLYHGLSNVTSVAMYWNSNIPHKYINSR